MAKGHPEIDLTTQISWKRLGKSGFARERFQAFATARDGNISTVLPVVGQSSCGGLGTCVLTCPCVSGVDHANSADTVQADALHWNGASQPLRSPESRCASLRGIVELIEEVEPDGEQILALPNLARCCLSCTA